MRVKVVATLVLAFGLSTAEVVAQGPLEGMSLKGALNYGLENSVEVRKAGLQKNMAQTQVGQTRSNYLPQVNGSAQFQNFPSLPTQLLPGEIIGQPGTQIPVQFGTSHNMTAGVEASQVIYSQELLEGIKTAKSSVELYELLKIKTNEDLIYQISRAFYQALDLQKQVEALRGNLELLDDLSALTQVQYQNDLVTKTTYNRVQVNKVNLESGLTALSTAETQQKNYLKLLMGMPMDSTLNLLEPSSMDELAVAALPNEDVDPIELRLLDQQLTLNALEQKRIKAGYIPSLAGFFQHQWQAQRNSFNFFDTDQPWFAQTVVGLKLQVPIFDGLNKRYKMQRSRLNTKVLELDRKNTELALEMQSDNAIAQLKSSRTSAEAQKENLQLAQEVYDQTQLLYKEDVASLTELLDAEMALREAQTNYNKELLRFKLAELDLIKSEGNLSQLAK